jgi:glycosyltransferase involved in cell wall biosynthesis
MPSTPQRVCVYAPVGAGEAGGIEQYVLGLAAGLSRLDDGREEYLFVADERAASWLGRYLAGPARLVALPPPARRAEWLGRARPLVEAVHGRALELAADVPVLARLLADRPGGSPGIERELGASLVHFATQFAFLTPLPTIYQPHDLQHLHLPRLFTRRERIGRERRYRRFCAEASLVVTSSSWARDDVAAHYGVPAGRLAVIPPGPPTVEYAPPTPERLEAVRRTLALDGPFAIYPAQTWPHKNHIGLLRALRLLKDRGLRVPLVAPGRRNEFFPRIERAVRTLGLSDQVRFVGFVTGEELQCLYRLARAAVVPTLFEAASFPVMEAQLAGVPVACSRVTSLPRQVGDTALLFDPADPARIADALERLWRDDALRADLAARGRENAARFTWARAARTFRAHYRRLAGWAMSDDDRRLVAADPGL